MPALNFSPEFVEAVESGKKRQTIRKQRKNGRFYSGDWLYLYTRQRTKACRKLGEAKCSSVTPIRIVREGMKIYLNNQLLSKAAALNVARRDGFLTPDSMCEWFAKRYGPEFDGVLIRW